MHAAAASPATRWRARLAAADGSSTQQWWGAVSTTIAAAGGLAATWVWAPLPWLLCWLWLVLPWWARGAQFARWNVALAAGFAVAMGGLLRQRWLPAPDRMPAAHPPFGEHPVTVVAGFPWAGVEGNAPYCLAAERVPFTMGVDALLANCAMAAAVVYLLLRRRPRASAQGLLPAAAVAAALASWFGGLELIRLFD